MHLLMLYVFFYIYFRLYQFFLPIFIYITMVFVMLWWSKLERTRPGSLQCYRFVSLLLGIYFPGLP